MLLFYNQAEGYMSRLNKKKFLDYDDWRIPTLEELASLLERKVNERGQHINSPFKDKQSKCWSTDPSLTGPYRDRMKYHNIVNFSKGEILGVGAEGSYLGQAWSERHFIRAVRSIK